MVVFYDSPAIEAAAIRRAAARSGCLIRSLAVGPDGRLVGDLACGDGWAAASLLLALSEEDAATAGCRSIARGLRVMAPDDHSFARAVHAYVRRRVRFEPEEGEIFQSGAFTLNAGVGDCDDHFRLVYALAVAGGLSAKLGILHHGDAVPLEKQGPAHAAALLCPHGKAAWAETTVGALYGENPNAAARRLGLTHARSDIAKEVVIMSSRDLPPVPPGFGSRNPPAQVALDSEVLERLGYLAPRCPRIADAGDPVFREAVLAFQIAAGILEDGNIGPQTRRAMAEALRSSSLAMRTDGGTMSGLDVKRTRHLPDEFFRELGSVIRRWRSLGATVTGEDFLGVLNAESGIRSNIPNHGGSPCYGLNQMCTFEKDGALRGFRAVGFPGTVAEWLALSPLAQLPYVVRYFENAVSGKGGVAKYKDATSLYLANIAPAFMAHADDPDFKIYTAPDRRFVDNAGVDADGNGAIEVRELRVFVERAKARDADARAFWAEVSARYAALGDEPPSGGAGLGSVVALGIVGAALTAWHVLT